MTNFTLNNHLTYSIGGRTYGHRETPIEKFKVALGPVDPYIFNNSSYEQELRRTADTVYKEFGKEFIVLLSGGTDSEIVVNNFLSIGIKPRCVALKFKNDYNKDDINEAIRISKDLDIKLDVVEFDIEDFFYSGEAKEFGEQIQCTQITYNMCYYNIMKLSLPAIMGGESLLTRQIEKDYSYWYYTFRENEDASAIRFSNKFNIPLVNEWFSYTPELLLYYLEDPDIVNLVSEKLNLKLTSVSSKNRILKKLCPYIIEKTKTHGFENLLAFNYTAYKDCGTDLIKRLEHSLDGIAYVDAISQLRAQL